MNQNFKRHFHQKPTIGALFSPKINILDVLSLRIFFFLIFISDLLITYFVFSRFSNVKSGLIISHPLEGSEKNVS